MTPARPNRRRPLRHGAALAFALLLAPPVLYAQVDETAATISGILDVADRNSRQLLPGPTRRALVRRNDSESWLLGHKDQALLWEDHVLVEPRTLVRLGLSGGAARGTASLSANLQTPTGELLVNEIGGHERALYRIGRAPEQLGDLQLAVARGSLALDWARGRLVLLAGGLRSVVTGTHLVVAYDSVTQRGFIHLIDGHVTFPDRPELVLRAGEWVQFQGSVVTSVGVPTAVAPERLADASRWQSGQAWPGGPFYKRPLFFVAAGLIGAGVYFGMREGMDYEDPNCAPRQC